MGTDVYGFGPLNLLVLVLLFGVVLLVDWPIPWRRQVAVKGPVKVRRPLKPKAGDDCPLCQAEQGAYIGEGGLGILPRPWREGRSRRGRKKEIATEGYACANRACGYYGITDQRIHALVADGMHGKYERIQDLVCQACGRKFTVRRHTVLYRLKTHSARVAEALTFLAEGVDVSVLERVWRIGEGPLRTWLTRGGPTRREAPCALLPGPAFSAYWHWLCPWLIIQLWSRVEDHLQHHPAARREPRGHTSPSGKLLRSCWLDSTSATHPPHV